MFSQFFIQRPVFACVVSIILVLIGAVTIPLLPIEQSGIAGLESRRRSAAETMVDGADQATKKVWSAASATEAVKEFGVSNKPIAYLISIFFFVEPIPESVAAGFVVITHRSICSCRIGLIAVMQFLIVDELFLSCASLRIQSSRTGFVISGIK